MYIFRFTIKCKNLLSFFVDIPSVIRQTIKECLDSTSNNSSAKSPIENSKRKTLSVSSRGGTESEDEQEVENELERGKVVDELKHGENRVVEYFT